MSRSWRSVPAALALAAWLFSGLTPARHVAAATDITVYRDHYGVAHVEAQSLQGLAYATGYLTAKDRLFEMDIIRKLGQGRLSELEGPSLLPMDRYERREFLLTADIEAQYRALTPVERELYQAYADGVNQGALETLANPTTTPALFAALADPWEPWTPEDSVVVDMVFTMVTFGGEGAAGQLGNATLLSHLEAQYGRGEGLRMFDDLVPPTSADAPTTIPAGEGPRVPTGAGYDVTAPTVAQEQLVHLPGLQTASAAQTSVLDAIKQAIADFHIPLPRIGSYAAAVSGSRTASGGPLLLGSPQSGLLAPPIFYELGWHIPGKLDCEGFTVPGLGPAIGIGWCNQHAWTLVAGNAGDQADLFVERLNPQDQHQYWYAGGWHQSVQRSTTYVVKDTVCVTSSDPVANCPPHVIRETYDYTVHGPINAVDSQAGVGFAYRRAQTGVFLRSLLGSLGWNLSTSMRGFMDAADSFTATYNLVYADTAGHIAYRFTGLQPVRPGTDRRLPVPGDGSAEWRGFLSQCAMPNDTDPATGQFAVNQGIESKPIAWWPNSAAIGIGAVSRVGHDNELLASLRSPTMQDMQVLNKRYLQQDDPYASLFYPLFAHALQGAGDPLVQAALTQLEAWRADGFRRTQTIHPGVEDHPGLAIFELDNIDYAPKSPTVPGAGFAVPMGKALIATVLDAPTAGLIESTSTYQQRLSDVYEALTGRTAHRFVADPDATILAVTTQVVHALAKQYGSNDPSAWHQPFPSEPFTAVEAIGPKPVSGMDHGSYSQIVDLGAGAGEDVEPPGNIAADSATETLQVALGMPPAHFDDQRALYQSYGFKPMLMRATQYRSHPEATMSLSTPAGFGSDTTLPFTTGRDRCRDEEASRGGVRAIAESHSAPAVLPDTATTRAPWIVAAGVVALIVARRRRRSPS